MARTTRKTSDHEIQSQSLTPANLSERRWEALAWGLLRLIAARNPSLSLILYDAMTEAGVGRFFDPNPCQEFVERFETFCRVEIPKLASLTGKTQKGDRNVLRHRLLQDYQTLLQELRERIPLDRGLDFRRWRRAISPAVNLAVTRLNRIFPPNEDPNLPADVVPKREPQIKEEFWKSLEMERDRRPPTVRALARHLTAHLWKIHPATATIEISRARSDLRRFGSTYRPSSGSRPFLT